MNTLHNIAFIYYKKPQERHYQNTPIALNITYFMFIYILFCCTRLLRPRISIFHQPELEKSKPAWPQPERHSVMMFKPDPDSYAVNAASKLKHWVRVTLSSSTIFSLNNVSYRSRQAQQTRLNRPLCVTRRFLWLLHDWNLSNRN